MKNFAEHLKALRISKNLTQKQLAKEVGLAENVYQRYERDLYKPSFETLIALADYFNITLDELVGRSLDKQI
ncbi:MAG: helix-turn-helix transcriptional regulator [Oscillospiraceae bacterium]|nr:helix-turn-helix transcriptional regulator [Oscillospiraceae bacterium]